MAINFDDMLKKDAWTTEEAACFLCGVSVDEYSVLSFAACTAGFAGFAGCDSSNWHTENPKQSAIFIKHDDIKEKLENAHNARVLCELSTDSKGVRYYAPKTFINWAISRDIDVPVELRDFVKAEAVGNDGAGSQGDKEPASARIIQANSNEFEYSGLLNIPRKKDGWFRAIDDMTKAFYTLHGTMPNEHQAWAQLWASPPDGYLIATDKYRGENCLKMPAENKPLSISMFTDRWRKYTAQKTE